jgi:hypothetical protein
MDALMRIMRRMHSAPTNTSMSDDDACRRPGGDSSAARGPSFLFPLTSIKHLKATLNTQFTLGHVLPKMSACLQFGQKTPTDRVWGSISDRRNPESVRS